MITSIAGKLVRVSEEEVRLQVGALEYQVMVPELVRRDLVDDGARGARDVGAAVRGARVDDDDFDLLVDLLGRDPVEAADEIVPAVLDGDDDRDHRGVAARMNW